MNTDEATDWASGLASIRGIAALAVVAYHALLLLKIDGQDNLYLKSIDLGSSGWVLFYQLLLAVFNGPAFVTLFFVLSGCVISISLRRGFTFSIVSLFGYWIKRLFRLYPLLVFAALLAALLSFAIPHATLSPLQTSWAILNSKVFDVRALTAEALKNAAGISSTLDSPIWSIKVEIIGSIILPFLYLLTRTSSSAAYAIVALAILMFCFPNPVVTAYLNVYAFSFFVGALIPQWGRHIESYFHKQSPRLQNVAIALAICLLMLTRRILSPDLFCPPASVLVESLSSALIVTLVYFGYGSRLLDTKIFRFLGFISFGIYLLHLPVLIALTNVTVSLFRLQSISNFGLILLVGAIFSVGVLITTILAFIAQRLVEAPMQRVGRQLCRQLSPKQAVC